MEMLTRQRFTVNMETDPIMKAWTKLSEARDALRNNTVELRSATEAMELTRQELQRSEERKARARLLNQQAQEELNNKRESLEELLRCAERLEEEIDALEHQAMSHQTEMANEDQESATHQSQKEAAEQNSARLSQEQLNLEKAVEDSSALAYQSMERNSEAFGQWIKEAVFLGDSRSLIYPVDRAAIPGPNARESRQNYALLQQLNNPAYITDRLYAVVNMLAANAHANSRPEERMPSGADYDNIQLCSMLVSASSYNLVTAAFKAKLATLVSHRVDKLAVDLVRAANAKGTNLRHAHAKGQAAEQLAKEYHGRGKTSRDWREENPRALKKQILAAASSGTCLRRLTVPHSTKILLLLPIAELMIINGHQTMGDVHKSLLNWICNVVLNNSRLSSFLRELIAILDNIIDDRAAMPGLKADFKDTDFFHRLCGFRISHNLPALGRIAFGPLLSPSVQLLECEMRASTSGWDTYTSLPAQIDADGPKDITDPAQALTQVMGLEQDDDVNGLPGFVFVDMGGETLSALVGLLLPSKARQLASHCSVMVLDLHRNPVDMASLAGYGNPFVSRVFCLVETQTEWTAIMIEKRRGYAPQDGRVAAQVFDHAYILHPHDEGFDGRIEQLTAKLPLLKGGLKVTHVDVPAAEREVSAIHACCHVVSMMANGCHWVTDIDAALVMDLRHLCLRLLSRALIDSVPLHDDEEDEGEAAEEGDGSDEAEDADMMG